MNPALPDTTPADASSAQRPSARLWGALMLGVLLLAAVGYWRTGAFSAALQWDREGAAQAAAAASANEAHSMDAQRIAAMLDRLAQRLKAQPDDAEGWAMLARSYAILGRHADAVPAYQKAVALQGNDPGLLVDYADALAVTHNGTLAGEPMALVQRALAIDPDNLKGLALAGSEAFERKAFPEAVRYWEHAARVAPPNSPYLPQLHAGVVEARARGGMPPAAATAQADSAAPATAQAQAPAGAARISGRVSLAPALRGQVAPEDTVFVFARAVNGPRMPIAVLRKQVKDLPFDFTLDDSMAMSPERRLSSFSEVTLVARVSKSGSAMPQPGDLSVEAPAVTVGKQGVALQISAPAAR